MEFFIHVYQQVLYVQLKHHQTLAIGNHKKMEKYAITQDQPVLHMI